ncbi:hypothetical protein [Marinifilum flexuosum]|uniref:EF-hand domain-containing protein n=1 Tax=Marinifilum flexuosum TaxID=1117708 RepID=A0A419X328_9BACT|nr:hypothetical protein [Marinifilum flexuosum]RKE02103.1 hypothetical protein BXY64_2184 [Marinifilum flexuosum]
MNEISLPYHLIIPGLISILILGIIIFKRKALFANRKRKCFWISVTVFFGIYLLIVGGATFVDISLELDLQKYDLNGDGFFSGEEITPEQEEAMHKVISDTARNFSLISGLIFSGIIAFFVFIFGRTIEYINGKRIKTKQANV